MFDEVVFNDSVEEFLKKKQQLANYFDESQDEDIFDYIPPQKTNQIFTPKWVVSMMVDQLEENNPGCFDDPNKTFADLYMKSGLYITEIVKRLYRSEGLKTAFPDGKERIRHILQKQVYARFVQGRTEVLIERLSSLCGPETGRQSNFQQLCQLLQGCEDALRTDLERELTESADYYQMYRRQYFRDLIGLEERDTVVVSDGILLDNLFCALQGSCEYTLRDYMEVADELQKDMREHADTFFRKAHQIYESWCAKPEALAECLGKDISPQELERVGLGRNQPSD